MSNMQSTLNVCFMCLCLNDNNCTSVNETVINRITSILPEITIFKLGVPLYICCNCEASLELFSKFKEACLENSLSLEASIKEAQLNLQNVATEANNIESTSGVREVEQIFIKEVAEHVENIVHNTNSTEERDTVQNNVFVEPLNENEENIEYNMEVQIELVEESDWEDDGNVETNVPDTNKRKETELETEDLAPISVHCERKTTEKEKRAVVRQGYLCGICHQSFISIDDMDIKQHMLRDHSAIGNFPCKLCDKVFDREVYLYVHMQHKIHTQHPNLRCFICGRLFTKASHLQTHLKLYVGVREFQCAACQLQFSTAALLERHEQQHRQARLRCAVCGMWLAGPAELEQHQATHTQLKRFSCYRCHKFFTMKHNMLKHIRHVHKKIKNYQCAICNKLYTCKNSLEAHMKWHETINKIHS